jgi:hypothetical protein
MLLPEGLVDNAKHYQQWIIFAVGADKHTRAKV